MVLTIKTRLFYNTLIVSLVINLQAIFFGVPIVTSISASGESSYHYTKPSLTKIKEGSGKNAPDNIAIFDEKHNKVFLDSFEGKTLLISFWATWCASCLTELPELDALQKDFRKLSFEVIAVSEDFQGVEIVKKYFAAEEIRHLKIYHDYKNSLFNALSVVGLPTSFLVNHNGEIVKIFTGPVNWYDDDIRNMLLEHIPGNPVKPNNSYQQNIINQVNKKNTPQPKPEENDVNSIDKVDINGKNTQTKDDNDEQIINKAQPKAIKSLAPQVKDDKIDSKSLSNSL